MNKEEFVKHCWYHAGAIYVREQMNGEWGAYNLNELPREKADYWINRWFEENRMPVMVKEASGVGEGHRQ